MALAKRGARNLDSGEEKIEDSGLAALLRSQATNIHVLSLVAAGLVTALFFIVFP